MLFNGVLIPRLFNNPFACCSLINFEFLLQHMAHFDNIIVLPLLVFEIHGFMLSEFFFYTLNNKKALFYIMFDTLNCY